MIRELTAALTLTIGICILLALPIAAASDLRPEDQSTLIRLKREGRYLEERASKAQKILGEKPELVEILQQAKAFQLRCSSVEAADIGRLKTETERNLGLLSSRVFSLLLPQESIVASLCDPYVQLDPTYLPDSPPLLSYEIVALAEEHHAVGLTLTNCTGAAIRCQLSLEGFSVRKFRCEIRKQVFIENWYGREKERRTDPLTLLVCESGAWKVEVPAGDTVRLHIAVQPHRGASGVTKGFVTLHPDTGRSHRLSLAMHVLPSLPPKSPRFDHFAFLDITSDVVSRLPELTGKNLAAHGVTAIEFAQRPPAMFTPQGDIASVSFEAHDQRLRALGPYIDRFAIFWQGSGYDNFACTDGTKLKYLSDSWRRGYTNLLRAFMQHAAKSGFGAKRFILFPADEVHSPHIDQSPEGVQPIVELYKVTRSAVPDLPLMVTLTYYTFPRDVEAILPYVDIAVPTWPYVDKLPAANAPATYNPAKAYRERVYPMLETRRKKEGMQIWSYHVASGNADAVLACNRATLSLPSQPVLRELVTGPMMTFAVAPGRRGMVDGWTTPSSTTVQKTAR